MSEQTQIEKDCEFYTFQTMADFEASEFIPASGKLVFIVDHERNEHDQPIGRLFYWSNESNGLKPVKVVPLMNEPSLPPKGSQAETSVVVKYLK